MKRYSAWNDPFSFAVGLGVGLLFAGVTAAALLFAGLTGTGKVLAGILGGLLSLGGLLVAFGAVEFVTVYDDRIVSRRVFRKTTVFFASATALSVGRRRRQSVRYVLSFGVPETECCVSDGNGTVGFVVSPKRLPWITFVTERVHVPVSDQ